jgi:hypothetical protein
MLRVLEINYWDSLFYLNWQDTQGGWHYSGPLPNPNHQPVFTGSIGDYQLPMVYRLSNWEGVGYLQVITLTPCGEYI